MSTIFDKCIIYGPQIFFVSQKIIPLLITMTKKVDYVTEEKWRSYISLDILQSEFFLEIKMTIKNLKICAQQKDIFSVFVLMNS